MAQLFIHPFRLHRCYDVRHTLSFRGTIAHCDRAPLIAGDGVPHVEVINFPARLQ